MKNVKFSLLSQVDVNHEYFPEGVFRGLKVVPDQKTQIFMWNAGLLFKPAESGFELYYADTFTSDYVQELTEFLGGYYLRFNLFSGNQDFIYFTETALDQLTLHCYSNKHIAGGDEELLLPTLQANIGMNGSLGYVDLHLDEFVQDDALSAKEYTISFTARNAQWNYYLWNAQESDEAKLVIEDPNGKPFEGPVKQEMPDGSVAFHYTSGENIYPLRERPNRFCSLKKVSNAEEALVPEDVLVEKLPSASPASITSIENIEPDDQEIACSSIYVYL